MLALAWRYRWGCAELLALQAVLLGLGLAGLAVMGMAIDVIVQAAQGAPLPEWPWGLTPPRHRAPIETLLSLAAVVLMVAVVRWGVNYRYAVASSRFLQQRIVVDLRAQVYEKLQRLSFRFFAGAESGSLINRVTGDVQSVRSFFDGVILQVVTLAFSVVLYLVYMLRLDPLLTCLCLATTPVLGWQAAAFSRRVQPAYQRNRTLMDRLVGILSENARGVQVVKGFARQEEEIARFRRTNHEVKDQQQWIFWHVSLFVPTSEMLMSFNLFVLLAYGGYLVIEDRLALGTGLVVFAGLLQQFSSQVSKITGITNSVQQSLAGAARVFEILDAPVEVRSPSRPRRLVRPAGRIEFDSVSFRYQPCQRVLEAISFRVEPGQQVAILGATGAGKTTLLHLVPRFYDVTGGRLLVDGLDVRSLDLDNLRRNLGIVFQENFLFSDSIASNIAFGRPGASRRQVERAARIAAADEFIRALPEGYDTVLREAGKDLSGGQRQRLAIARAMLLEPPVLLLDDPTAAVDPGTEQEILDAMDRAMAGRTTLVVAHRLSTLRRADLVLVLRDGRIAECGSHDQLMNRCGPYWKAARLQIA